MSSQTLRKRTKKSTQPSSGTSPAPEDAIEKVLPPVRQKDPENWYWIALAAVTAVAAFVRFRIIGDPDRVVFDEVHFGKFASYYLERTYFFDLHPPFAKLLIAFVGWLMGYDGKFKFDTINEDYVSKNVPYVAYRSLSAIQGTAIIPVMFLTLKTLGFTVASCVLGTSIVLFDNAHIIDSRLILLDATLNLSVATTIYAYCKFSTYRRQPFSKWWWTWLSLTGISLSCVISTKYVGVFTYMTIGVAVLHELWILLDINRGLTMEEFGKHFFARLFTLIVIPFFIYLYWFYLHFAILTKSGPGDPFMSSDFQETLAESPLAREAKTVNYHDIITIKHKETNAFLHSFDFEYPLRYEDGRISSNKQGVICVFDQQGQEIEDVNSQWEIVPTDEKSDGQTVHTNDVVRFRHVGTGGFLLTHDVASTLLATNEEFVIVHGEDADEHYKETLFRLRYADNSGSKNPQKVVKTKGTPLRIVHVDTVVAMWTHDDELMPDWANGQQEVSGNKKVQEKENIWTFDTIVSLSPDDKRSQYVPKQLRTIPFLKKWWELQGLMFHHNNKLSSEHPFASQPGDWPLAVSGVSFWNDNEARRQIFFIGNVVGFWIEVGFLAVYVGFVLADLVTRRRDYNILSDKARSMLYNTLGFLFIGWAVHYLPFFLMNRQKFLHHYLPAHLIGALFTGAAIEFLCMNKTTRVYRGLPPLAIDKSKMFISLAIVVGGTAWFLWYFRFVTYGNFAISPEEVKKRQWLDFQFHYAK